MAIEDRSDQQGIQMICTLINSIFLEAPHQIRLLLLSCAVPPDALPYCVEHVSSFSSAIEMLPELLAKDTTTRSPSYRYYYADLASWLATKYASPRFEAAMPLSADLLAQANSFDSCLAALTIGVRLCIALPQLCLLSLHPQLILLSQEAKRLAVDQNDNAILEMRIAQIITILQLSSCAESNSLLQYICVI
jgi:hypothetical protein